ncbi:MAG TPA: CHAT domain-containing protein [Blastocatellia bacterium]|nr:CHAT domain-containing protein [Blastocatellia bacterium]
MQSALPTRRLVRQLTGAADLDGFLAANRHRFDTATVIELKDEVDRLVKVDLTQAEPLALATRKLARVLKDPVSIGFGDAAVAQVHHYSGRLNQAEPLYMSAIDRLRLNGRTTDAAALERQLVGLFHRQGRADDALALARKARRTLARAGEHALVAQLENNVGTVYYYTLGEFRTALRYFDRARAIFDRLGDVASLAVVDFNRANVLLELDRPHEAAELYLSAERMNLAEGRAVFASQCSYELAFTLASLGRYGEALKRFYSSRERLAELGDGVLAAWAALYLSELHFRLNTIDEAALLATEAGDEFSAMPHHGVEAARTRVVRARVMARKGDHAGAESELSRAERVFARHSLPVLAADARLARAEVALDRGNPKRAATLASEARSVFASQRLGTRGAHACLVEAQALHASGDANAALALARKARRAAERASDPWLAVRVAWLVGSLELARGRHDAGVASLERAVDGIERLRVRLRPGEARTGFLADKLAPYEQLVAINLERGDADGLRKAFRYVEMAKSRSLADLMAHHVAGVRPPGVPTAEARLRDQLARRLEELSWYSSRIANQAEKGGQRNTRLDAHLRTELARCERELESAFRRLEVEDAGFAELISAEPTEIDDLAAGLETDEAAIEFFVTGDQIAAFVVTPDGSRAYNALADRRSVEAHVTGLRYQLEKFALGARYASAHRDALRRCVDNHLSALYGALIAPLAGEIEGRRLLIVPHGLLHYVPMHALKAPNGRYVVELHEVSYAPSATVHRLCRGRSEPTTRATSMLAVGLDDAMAPHIVDELKSLEGLFPEVVMLAGQDARKQQFLELAPQSKILHLATHGSFRHDNPMFSSVRMADGPLNFYDVFDMSLDADLVTLSACNTGMNRLSPGDELNGLMRGFLYAGAPSLVVSLWAVNDRSTADLMETFYGQLQAGADKRAALRAAELESLDRYGHPYYWAPFVLMGRP